MTTPTATDLPGRSAVGVRILICLVVVVAAAGAGAYWAYQRGGMVASQADPILAVAIPAVVAAGVLALWSQLHRRRGREPAVAVPATVTRPPSDHPPAVVGWLLRFGTVVAEDVAATLIDLVRRDAVAVDAQRGMLGRRVTSPSSSLAAHEQVLLEWLFDVDMDGVPAEGRAAEITGNPRRWETLMDDFSAAVAGQGRSEGLVERTAAAEEVMSVGLLSSGVVVAGTVGMALGYPAWSLCIAAGAVVSVFADTLARRSPAGAELAARWRAYCGHLSSIPDARADYAVALDVETTLTTEEAFLVAAVRRWRDAYVTASAFLKGPTVSLRTGRALHHE